MANRAYAVRLYTNRTACGIGFALILKGLSHDEMSRKWGWDCAVNGVIVLPEGIG